MVILIRLDFLLYARLHYWSFALWQVDFLKSNILFRSLEMIKSTSINQLKLLNIRRFHN